MLDARSADTIEVADDRAVGTLPPRAAAPETKKPVCIVLHQEQSNPGHVGQWFRRNGHALDIRKPRYGDPLPETLEHHCGAVVFGGPMSANDKDAFVRQETEWIGVALEEKKPFLGICLGAQMLTNLLGGRVGFHPEEMVEVGYYPLVTTPEGGRLGAFPDHVYQWHREGCELPDCARLLATCATPGAFPAQAFGCGAAIGVQFHPEITYAQVRRWTGHNTGRLDMKGARQQHEHIEGHIAHGPKVQAWLDRFLDRWVRAELVVA
jgi:GMP synthase (glutamine-hydrolysing)